MKTAPSEEIYEMWDSWMTFTENPGVSALLTIAEVLLSIRRDLADGNNNLGEREND